jgi:Uri superfamily endonuclease
MQKGSYLLVFQLPNEIRQLQVGRLGCFDFAPGYYLYIGSAFGSGGLAARLRHHARCDKPRPHWHIDYLRPHMRLLAAWTLPARMECVWCRAAAARPWLSAPIRSFGARDTGCLAHLFYSLQQPSDEQIRELLMCRPASCSTNSESGHFLLEKIAF